MVFQKIWIEQCEATEGIRERFGIEKALGYLIGEKLVNFVEEADGNPDWAQELPQFIAEIKRIFSPTEIRDYLDTIRRTGVMGHACTEDEFELFRETGAIRAMPIRGSPNAYTQIAKLFLEEASDSLATRE